MWLLTEGSNGEPWIFAHFLVASNPRKLRSPPQYARGTSLLATAYEVRTDSAQAQPLLWVKLGWRQLHLLRFDSKKDRVIGYGIDAYGGDLAALKQLRESSAEWLNRRWSGSWPRGGRKREHERRSLKGSPGMFGEPEPNRIVERAAVAYSRKVLVTKGWSVSSVESDRCGYDLLATKGDRELHVEVKGRSSDERGFLLTRGEFARAKDDPCFVLHLVRQAIVAPRLEVIDGGSIARTHRLEPVAYFVTPRR